MKKLSKWLVGLVLTVALIGVNANAATKLHSFGAEFYEDESSLRENDQDKHSIYKLGEQYYYKNSTVTGVNKEVKGEYTILSLSDEDEKVESWYKYIDSKDSYAHVKNVYFIKYDDIRNASYEYEYNFRYYEANCKVGTDLNKGSCTNKYDVSTHRMNTKYHDDVNSNYSDIYYFSPFATKIGHLDKSESRYQYTNNNKVVKENDILKVTRNKSNLIVRTDFHHYKSNIKRDYVKETTSKPKTSNYYYFEGSRTWYRYNTSKQLVYKRTAYTKKSVEYEINQTRTYHKNGKVRKLQEMVYKDGKKTKATKIYYTNKGVRTSKKERKYSKEILTQQAYLKYSKGKKKYLNIVKCNKKGKAYKATRTTYNKKGKKIKTYRIKITKSITKW